MRPADAESGVAEEPQNKGPNWFQRWRMGISNLVHRMDTSVGKSPVGRFFRLKGSGHVSSSYRGNKLLLGVVGVLTSLTRDTASSRKFVMHVCQPRYVPG